MTKALVTGSTGFVGSNLVLALNRRGIEVRALQRKTSPQDAISGLEYEPVVGDLLDADSLVRAVDGVDWVFHVAAVSDWRNSPADVVYRVNVDGARNMMEAAKRAGVKRFVLTSSLAALGVPPPGRDHFTESDVFNLKPEAFPYGHSKHLAELEAEKYAADGLHVVSVLPSGVMGPRDLKFISGEIIVQVLKRGIPGAPPGGLNYIDVRDLVEGHIAAAERGRSGERYILGGNNMTHRETIDTVARVVGVRPPALDIPRWAIPAMAIAFDALSALGVKLPGNVDGGAVRLSKEFLYCDTSKAKSELGLNARPFEESARDAYEWYRANDYL
jgi:dihydroflavonol-4-reductase